MDGREFVATIAIISHGWSTEFEISPTIANIFDNARIYTLSNQTGPVIAGSVLCTRTHNHLNKIFRRTLHNENTLHILEEYAKYSEPKYASFYSDMNERGKIYDPITFDKMYSVIEPDNYMGIFLISVHEKVPGHDNELRLVYPLLEHKNQNIDLAKLDDITTLGNYLGNDNITNIVAEITNGASPAFPEKERMQMMGHHIHGETLGEMSKRFTDNRMYSRYIQDGRIMMLRMSYLAKMLKQVLGKNTRINFLDYSCSNPREGISAHEMEEYVRYKTPGDIETGMNRAFGGNPRKKRRRTWKKMRGSRRRRRTKKKARSMRNRRKRKSGKRKSYGRDV
jgi:hypothetical protein